MDVLNPVLPLALITNLSVATVPIDVELAILNFPASATSTPIDHMELIGSWPATVDEAAKSIWGDEAAVEPLV